MTEQHATGKSVSLYPDHWEAIEEYAKEIGMRGPLTRSPTLQRIIEEHQAYRRLARTLNHRDPSLDAQRVA